MQVLTRDELLLLVGLTSSAFDQLAHAGHVALAFGTAVPGVPGRYLDLDAVAIAISQGLTPSLGRNVATLVVAGFFEEWASAVGQAVVLGHFASGPAPEVLLVTAGGSSLPVDLILLPEP